MSDSIPTFRVSSAYIRNLYQQALFAALGMVAGWGMFLAISLWLKPSLTTDHLRQIVVRLADPTTWLSGMWTTEEERELQRFAIGPALVLCVLLGSLADVTSWLSVRYEIHSLTLRMRMRRLQRQIAWDLIHSVDERPNARADLCSLKITQNGAGAILVRGLESMSEFKEQLKLRLPRLSHWVVSPVRIDLTNPLTNFAFGFLILIPLAGSWIAYHVAGVTSIGLFWAVVLLPVAYWIWFHQPMSRSHTCAREVEVGLVLLTVILSGTLTLFSWMDLSAPIPMAISRWLGW